MKKIFQSLPYLFLTFLIISCNDPNGITINKVIGSPAYENSKLFLTDVVKVDDQYMFHLISTIITKEYKLIKTLNII